MKRYYAFHSKIYDLTRWSFLFGRDEIVQLIARHSNPTNGIEIGCGTGKNLQQLAKKFPQAKLVGLDVSEDMIRVSKEKLTPYGDRISFVQAPYTAPLHNPPQFDLIVCSYSLTMINPGFDEVIKAARADLKPDGLIAVVDFHASPIPPFKSWMGVNHVRMDAHLLPVLEENFQPVEKQVRSAYLGIWQYLLFIGKPR